MLIPKKILWRINLVLTKFLPNALLFEKLQNGCKNVSFLHKFTCFRSDNAGAVAKCSHSWFYTLGGFAIGHSDICITVFFRV